MTNQNVIALYLTLSALDIISTVIGIGTFGLVEKNPVARWFIGEYGLLEGTLLQKSLGLGILGGGGLIMQKLGHRKKWEYILWGGCIITGAVVVANAGFIFGWW